MASKLRTRSSLLEIQTKYEQGEKKPLEDMMRAWKVFKEREITDPKSFFKLAGFHAMPFSGAGRYDAAYWGGHCQHGNVLFPTWHRTFIFKIEEALRSVPGCENVTLPYWDETDEYTMKNGIPWVLTDEKFELDGELIDNPLRSYKLPVTLLDTTSDNNYNKLNYSKPKDYETRRYPLAGLAGTENDQKSSELHNAKFPDYKENVKILNENVKGWLEDKVQGESFFHRLHKDCLKAPNYTVFSNVTSAREWNLTHPGEVTQISLEGAHNNIHMMVGAFSRPRDSSVEKSPDLILGASGDMGENDTAAFDPLFYFHHSNADRLFWIWQKTHGMTDDLELIREYPGTNSSDDQGPTPGFAPNQWLDFETPLYPFYKKTKDGKEVPYTSRDVFNIEKQLGYTYTIGTLDKEGGYTIPVVVENGPKLIVSGIDRSKIKGSFMIEGYLRNAKEKILLGYTSVISRWNISYCKNCQNNLEVGACWNLPDVLLQDYETDVIVKTHGQAISFYATSDKEKFESTNQNQNELQTIKVTYT